MADSNENVFLRIIEEAKEKGVALDRSQEARDWFRERAGDVPEVSTHELIDSTEERLFKNVSLGGLYLFHYDPKTKDKLPYYDANPLVFPVQWSEGGFKGLNLHYLPPMHRAALMDELYKIASNAELDNKTRIVANYTLLNSMGSFKAFKPCFKRYLNRFVTSQFLAVKPVEWDIALFLPLENFQKAGANRIYNDSLRAIGRRKKRVF